MKRNIVIGIMGLLIGLTGCAASLKDRQKIETLEHQAAVTSQKFELAKKENLNLKRELVLFKKNQDIDTKRFIQTLDLFEKRLAGEIAKDGAWVQITERGLEVTVLAERLFVTASDALSDDGKALLDTVSDVIQKEFPRNYIYIEGHTDDQSLAVFEWKTDWDFSFARALSILKYFTRNKGINPLRLSASGFGQYRPKVSNDTKEGRRLNRRMVIIISPQKIKIPQS